MQASLTHYQPWSSYWDPPVQLFGHPVLLPLPPGGARGGRRADKLLKDVRTLPPPLPPVMFNSRDACGSIVGTLVSSCEGHL